SGTRKWLPTASKSFGVDRCRRRQDRLRNPLDNLGIRARLTLRQHLLDKLDTALKLLIGHRLDATALLDLHLARHQKRADLQVCRGVLLPHLCNGFRPMTLEVGSEREQEILVERSTSSSFPCTDAQTSQPKRVVACKLRGLDQGVSNEKVVSRKRSARRVGLGDGIRCRKAAASASSSIRTCSGLHLVRLLCRCQRRC